MRCPSCGRNQTGRVGTHEFFCWNCCLEFHGEPGRWRLFAVDPEGALVEVGPAAPPPSGDAVLDAGSVLMSEQAVPARV